MLQELAETLGFAAAIALAERYGGTEICVPARDPSGDHSEWQVWADLGGEVAGKLIQRFRGERLYIPKGDHALRCARNRAIVAEYRGDVTYSDLARKHGLTARRISDILNGPTPETGGKKRTPPGQMSFRFDEEAA